MSTAVGFVENLICKERPTPVKHTTHTDNGSRKVHNDGGNKLLTATNETNSSAMDATKFVHMRSARKSSVQNNPINQLNRSTTWTTTAGMTTTTATTSSSNSALQRTPVRRSWRDQPNIGKYKLIRTLGRGNFAKVKLAQHVSTGREVAVKVIDKTQLNQASLKKLFREVNVMKSLNHPNIVRLYEVIESERHVYLIMEYAENGEVFDYLVANGRMKEKEARARFREIVSAVEYCHQKKIVHRDLKAENLLLDENYNIKLADFGFSNHFDGSHKLDTFCGSPPYAAPELFQGRKYDGPEVDAWSLGVILYTLVSGALPFDAQHLKDLQERVLRGKYRVPFYMTTACEALIRKLLVLNPSKRITLRNVMSDAWLNIGYDDQILKPYTEPPTDYNDPVRIAIMQEMGYKTEDIHDALKNQRFNNVTAIYLLLADPKTRTTLPNLNLKRLPREIATGVIDQSFTDDHPPKRKSSTEHQTNSGLKVYRGNSGDNVQNGRDSKNTKEINNGNTDSVENGKGDGTKESHNQYNGLKRINVSWLKQSSSAGPATTSSSNKQDSSIGGVSSSSSRSPNPPSNQTVGTQNGQRGNSIKGDNENHCESNRGSSNEFLNVRRMNTFSMSDKLRQKVNLDANTQANNCPLSRAPPMSNIPNHLTGSRNEFNSLDSTSNGKSAFSNVNNDSTIKFNETTILSDTNPILDWIRRTIPHRFKPSNLSNTPKSVMSHNKHLQTKSTNPLEELENSSQITVNNGDRDTSKSNSINQSTDPKISIKSASVITHQSASTTSSTMTTCSSSTSNSVSCSDSKKLNDFTDTDNVQQGSNTRSIIPVIDLPSQKTGAYNSCKKWSVRHRPTITQTTENSPSHNKTDTASKPDHDDPDHDDNDGDRTVSTLTRQSSNCKRVSLESLSSTQYRVGVNEKQSHTMKNAQTYHSSKSGWKPLRLLRTLTMRFGLRLVCGRFKPNNKSQQSTSGQQQVLPEAKSNNCTNKLLHQPHTSESDGGGALITESTPAVNISNNDPDPWITMASKNQYPNTGSESTNNSSADAKPQIDYSSTEYKRDRGQARGKATTFNNEQSEQSKHKARRWQQIS